MSTTFHETLDQIRVVRLELHEELMKSPLYRTLTALDDLLKIIEKATVEPVVAETVAEVPQPQEEAPVPEPIPEPMPMPEDAPQPVIEFKRKSKPLTQVQALRQVLRNKESPASLGWLLAELELLGVTVNSAQPRKSLGVVLSSNKELFRRVEYDGGRWLWGLKDRKYAGETTYDHLPATEFKSMKVARKRA